MRDDARPPFSRSMMHPLILQSRIMGSFIHKALAVANDFQHMPLLRQI